jgi:hypothetical protein
MINYYIFHSQETKKSPTQEPSLDNGNIASPSHHDDLDVHELRENAISPQDGDYDVATPEKVYIGIPSRIVNTHSMGRAPLELCAEYSPMESCNKRRNLLKSVVDTKLRSPSINTTESIAGCLGLKYLTTQ